MADHPQQAVARTAPAQSGNLADVLERVLDKGIVIAGDIKLLLAEVEVLTLQIRLVICSVDKAQEIGLDWWRGRTRCRAPRSPKNRSPNSRSNARQSSRSGSRVSNGP
jgi:hypothetical protein